MRRSNPPRAATRSSLPSSTTASASTGRTCAKRHSLADDKLPIPSVTWTAPGFRLDTTLLADSAGRAAFADYALTNAGAARRTIELRLGVRPWQVNPPAQFLAQQGGHSPISRIVRDPLRMAITQPQTEGDPPVDAHADRGRRRASSAATPHCPARTWRPLTSSTASTWRPGASEAVVLTMPGASGSRRRLDRRLRRHQAHWRDVLGRVTVQVPPAKQAVADTLATAFAHILTSRDGPMLKPGTRSYDRAWIRDGAMMSEALLRLGRPDVARAFADWYRPNLFDSGKVPCCVDFRGADPVPENDSHGEYIFLVNQLYRFTGDRAALERDWPSVLAATRYMDKLRLSERTPANLTPARRMLYGLMPPSISHEGYSAKPQYSLWDDFWALRGYRDAAEIARLLGRPEAARNRRARATSSPPTCTPRSAPRATIGRSPLSPARPASAISTRPRRPSRSIPATSRRASTRRCSPRPSSATGREFQTRAAGTRPWKDYTPYETRALGSFVRLGWRDRIDPLLDFLHGRPPPRRLEPMGRSGRARRSRNPLHRRHAARLGGVRFRPRHARHVRLGAPRRWRAGARRRAVGAIGWRPRRAIAGLATPYGPLDFAMRGNARRLTATIGGTARPPGGFVLAWPFAGPRRQPASTAGRAWRDGALHPRDRRPIRSSRRSRSSARQQGPNDRIPRRLPVGRRHLRLSDRGLAPGRRRRAEHLAALRPHPA